MEDKIEKLLSKIPGLELKLGNPDIFQDQERFRSLTQEHSYLMQLKNAWETLLQTKNQLGENKELLKLESDPEFVEALREEIEKLEGDSEKQEMAINDLLVPPDPNDSRNTILEIRAGTGGAEAALFVADCVRMYRYYADKMGWKVETLSYAESEIGGFKEYTMVLSGKNVHRLLRYEAGTHRVQRVPETETQGRVHTSAITIAVLLEPSADEKVNIEEKDLRIDTYRASGAGGQHVNVTDSAVRITHIPTGVVVTCQEEKSQHKNKDKAMRLLQARIAEKERREKHKEIADKRSSQIGTGDRSEKIRTYNFPQNRVTDHRINLTKYNLELVMNGDLNDFTTALVAYFHQQEIESI